MRVFPKYQTWCALANLLGNLRQLLLSFFLFHRQIKTLKLAGPCSVHGVRAPSKRRSSSAGRAGFGWSEVILLRRVEGLGIELGAYVRGRTQLASKNLVFSIVRRVFPRYQF